MANYTDDPDIETPTPFEIMWHYIIKFLATVGLVASLCFVAGYLIVSQAPIEKPSSGVGANTSKGKKV